MTSNRVNNHNSAYNHNHNSDYTVYPPQNLCRKTCPDLINQPRKTKPPEQGTSDYRHIAHHLRYYIISKNKSKLTKKRKEHEYNQRIAHGNSKSGKYI